MKKEKDSTKLTIGQKMADRVAQVAGSWMFISVFCTSMAGWIVINLIWFKFDPYPFILLNLILSTIAALQAPLIMMSQNRQAEIDRARSIEDHELNKMINDKLDAILRTGVVSLVELKDIDKKLEEIAEDVDDDDD